MAQILSRIAGLSLGLGAVGSLAQMTLYNVDGGERAVMFNRLRGGIQAEPIGEGTHFRIPWVETPYIMDVRTRPRQITSTTGSKDLQTVQLTLRVLHRPELSALSWIYQKLGLDYDERILPSIGNEVLKAVVAGYDASELITQREHVSRNVREALTKRARAYNIILDDVSITHLSFSREFTHAIERKQVAQQEAERSKFVVMKAEQERRAAIIRAEGESESANLISDAIASSGPGLVALRRIEAAREIAETLSKSRGVTYLPDGGRFLMSLPASS